MHRFLLTAGLLLALVGCGAESVNSGRPPASGAAGDFNGPVEIGNGRHLYLECRGKGGPTVILESGYHDSSDPWTESDATAPAVGPAVLPSIAGDHRVCAYDRPGALRYSNPPSISDRSSPVPMPRTARDVVGDLHALLAAAHVPGPYVLVGHSLGGLFARLYAQTYPDQVRAVVFVDAFPVEIPRLMGSDWPAYRQALDGPLPQFANSSSFEIVDIDKSAAEIAAAPAFPPIPTIVLTKTEPFAIPPTVPAALGAKLEQVWQEAATDLVALRPQTPHIFATGSDHYIQVHQPDLVVAGVRLIMQRAAREGFSRP
ncbi:Putative aminoacrylate hydrolase RutD [Mycobacterium simulans]|uniref:Aminoacrylate hydrolase RutD n=1 Tax=Mycobacterium simulans TaxID=627089 RepID=A0A7Z7N7G9_9MYCO|nr:alpha/beta hydrolase [Mycobacterium simulans]SOJ52582.1 Putative aminoacrylate hydrolase RutD [Mycobacterium simulans]